MPDYTPVIIPGLTVTFTAATAVTGGDPVEVAGSGLVQACAAPGSPRYVGVAAADTAAGLLVTVFSDRVLHEGLADGPVTAGDQVMASSVPGRQVTAAPAPAVDVGGTFNETTINAALNAALQAERAVIGVAITNAPDGQPVRWMQK